jgi:hypothetical protein
MTAVKSTTATATAMCTAVVGSHYEQATAKKPGSTTVIDRVSLDCTSSRCTMMSTASNPNGQRGDGKGRGTHVHVAGNVRLTTHLHQVRICYLHQQYAFPASRLIQCN